jgi:hypothetical protein
MKVCDRGKEKTLGSCTRPSLDLGHSHVAPVAGSAIGETMISNAAIA